MIKSKFRFVRQVLSVSAILFAVGTANAWQPVVNEVHVDCNGKLDQDPVALHQPEVRRWLNDPDYTNSYYRCAYKDMPMIVKIVRGNEFQCFTNLCPGTEYDWSVGGFSGKFKTETQAPRTLLAKIGDGRWGYVRNFRDLGGLRLINSDKRTKFGVYYRSEKWEKHYEKDQREGNPMNSEFGIKSEIDLRRQDLTCDIQLPTANGVDEVGAIIVDESGNVLPAWSETTNTLYTESYMWNCTWFRACCPSGTVFRTAPSLPPGDESVRYFRCSLWEGCMNSAYNSFATCNVARVFSVLGNLEMLPSLFHCASGKDRTGFVGMFIEALCGVKEADIRRDYLLSYFSGVGYPNASYEDELKGQLYLGNHYNDGYDYSKTYGPSLTGRVRSYLERFGVTDDQIKTITMSLVGETPDEVLARVNEGTDQDGNELEDEADLADSNIVAGIPRVGVKVTDGDVLARGGDEVYQITENGIDYYVHYFTNTLSVHCFTNNTGKSLDVRYLAVGGGGAGGESEEGEFGFDQISETDFRTGAFGGGGGAGGGVLGSQTNVVADEMWTIYVGAGGQAAGEKGMIVPASASVISNVTEGIQIANVPGGGSGGSPAVAPTPGAAGGGAAAYGNTNVVGASGLYHSTVDGVLVGSECVGYPGAGSSSAKSFLQDAKEVKYYGNALAGGGGGAGGPGLLNPVKNVHVSGSGGSGLFSGITGIEVMYGAGGGGGGGTTTNMVLPYVIGGDLEGVIPGAGANGGGRGGAFQIQVDKRSGAYDIPLVFQLSPAQDGVAGTGGGGGGAGGSAVLFDSTRAQGRYCGVTIIGGNDEDGTKVRAGNGGDGIVIIRYAVPLTWKVSYSTNSVAVADAEETVADGDSPVGIPVFDSGFWEVDPNGAVIGCDTNFNYVVAPVHGGDRAYQIKVGGTTNWVHEFSSVQKVHSFVNASGAPLYVEYLVVGGGGAGGGAGDMTFGAGGGGGGAVVTGRAVIGASGNWSVVVGKGGVASGDNQHGSEPATASSIDGVATAAGGGAGACAFSDFKATALATGGGGGGGNGTANEYYNGTCGAGAAGTLSKGGDAVAMVLGSKTQENVLAGGGGGAGGDGGEGSAVADTVKSGDGGAGVVSSITGEAVAYGGGGGGGGGMKRYWDILPLDNCAEYGVGIGFGVAGGGNGGWGCYGNSDDAATLRFQAAQDGSAGTGGGGGGAGANIGQGGNGGSGIVIIRYATAPRDGLYITFE